MSQVIRVLIPEVFGREAEASKRLVRMAQAWARLSAEEQSRFRRHIDGKCELKGEAELIPTIQAAKILKTSFYVVKQMVTDGVLEPAETKHQTYGPTYKFRRSEIEEMAAKSGKVSIRGGRVSLTGRHGDIFVMRVRGLSFAAIGLLIGLSAGRVRDLALRMSYRLRLRQLVPIFHQLDGPDWQALNCDREHDKHWPASECTSEIGSVVNWRKEFPATLISSNINQRKLI